MEIPLRELVTSLDTCIRRGNAKLARQELEKLDLNRVPRDFVAPLAAMARRAGLPRTAIRLLQKFVRGKDVAPAPNESAEYAAALTYLGGADEASQILKGVDSDKAPSCLLYQAFAHFARWDYTPAIPLLIRYTKSREITEYQRMVGKLNLASALVYERADSVASQLVGELLEESGYPGYEFLRASALEVAAQFFIGSRNWGVAQKLLLEARASVRLAAGLQDLFVKKWRVILDLRRAKPNGELLFRLEKVREEAKEGRHWETVRDCDRAKAVALQDRNLLVQLYFGTPFASLRRRLLDDFGKQVLLPKSYAWNLGPTATEKAWDPRGAQLSPTALGLLDILCSDFYSPFRLTALSFLLFPNTQFDLDTSEAKVLEAVKEVRSELSRTGQPLLIDEIEGEIRLFSPRPFAIRVRLGTESGAVAA